MMKYLIYSDGGSRGNPGPASCGFVILSEPDHRYLVKSGEYLGKLTNNQAEYWGVIRSLEWLLENKRQPPVASADIEVRLDSALLVNQLRGIFKIKSSGLQQLVIRVKNLERKFKAPVTYVHVPREKNQDADRLVNIALDRELKPRSI